MNWIMMFSEIPFIWISWILRFWQWYSNWCFLFNFSRKIISQILRMLYLMPCEFLSWNKLFLVLTTNTATLCSFLFALCPRCSTWFLSFITYNVTLSPLLFEFYACYSTWSFHTFLRAERKIFSHVLYMLCCSSRNFGTTLILFPSVSLGALTSLLHTLLNLGLPQACALQGRSLRTNPADIMARPASPTKWAGLTWHRCRLFVPVLMWQSQKPNDDKELQWVHYHRQAVT